MEGVQSPDLNGASENTSRRACWDDITKEFFVTLLQETANMNNGHKKGCYNKRWEKISNRIRTKFPESRFSTEQLKQLERDLKKSYRSVNSILVQPGFTWDEIGCTLVASEDDWRNLFTKEPSTARRWYRKIFPYYGRLDALYGGHCVQVPQAMRGNALVEHNSSLFTSNSVPVGSNKEMNPSGILAGIDQIHDFRPEDYLKDPEDEGELNSPNFASSQNQDLCIDSQNQSDRNYEQFRLADQNGVAGVPDFSIGLCLAEYERLGSHQADLIYVGEIFKDEQNCESFLALKEGYKKRWLSDNIEMRKKARFKSSH